VNGSDPWVRDRPAGARPGRRNRTTRPRQREAPAAGLRRGKSKPRRARVLAHAHPAVQECDRFHQQRRGLFRNHEPPSSATRAPATLANALASAVTVARIHPVTPANSRDVAHSDERIFGDALAVAVACFIDPSADFAEAVVLIFSKSGFLAFVLVIPPPPLPTAGDDAADLGPFLTSS
jgi:hypothetical protein